MTIQDVWDGLRGERQVQEIGIGGFLLTAIESKALEMDSEIPDHNLEDGSVIQDHIIQRPKRIIVEGTVGDIHERPAPQRVAIDRVSDELGRITAYIPEKTAAQISRSRALLEDAADFARKVEDLINAGEGTAEFFGVRDPETPLGEQFIDFIETIRDQKQTIDLDFPFRKYSNMAVLTLSIERDNTGNALSYSITFKKVEFASTRVVASEERFTNPAPGTGGELEGEKNKGEQRGEEVPTSIAAGTLDFAIGG